jgi:hypothetical protein
MNKPSRVAKMKEVIQGILLAEKMSLEQASQLHGKLLYAQCQTSGRLARPALRVFSSFKTNSSSGGNFTLLLSQTLKFCLQFLDKAKPRVIRHTDELRPVLIFTDGACEPGSVTMGGLIYDTVDQFCQIFGGDIDKCIVDHWRTLVGEQVIGQAELYPIAIARDHWKQRLTNRRTIYFIDNDAARDGLIKGDSPSVCSRVIINLFMRTDMDAQAYNWFARVPSPSNPGDDPSRGRVKQAAALFKARVVELADLNNLFLAEVLLGELGTGLSGLRGSQLHL